MYPPLSQSEPLATLAPANRIDPSQTLASAGYLTLSSSSASLEVSMQDSTDRAGELPSSPVL